MSGASEVPAYPTPPRSAESSILIDADEEEGPYATTSKTSTSIGARTASRRMPVPSSAKTTMTRSPLPILLLPALCVAEQYRASALTQARKGEDASAHFRAAVFLDDAKTGAEQWHDLAVSLMRVAASAPTRSKNSSPEDAREARRASRHGIWALAAFELSGRLDPLRLKIKPKDAEENLAALLEASVDARRQSRLDALTPDYWRGSALLVHDLGVSVAKSGRQGESVLHFWRRSSGLEMPSAPSEGSAASACLVHPKGARAMLCARQSRKSAARLGLALRNEGFPLSASRQIIDSEAEVPVAWVNLAVALNQVRQWAGDTERFEALSACALAALRRAANAVDRASPLPSWTI